MFSWQDTEFWEEIDTQIVRLFTYSLFSKCYSAKFFFPQSISCTRQASVFLTSLEGWGTDRSQTVILSSCMHLWTKGVRKTRRCLQDSCLVLQPTPGHTHREEQVTLMKKQGRWYKPGSLVLRYNPTNTSCAGLPFLSVSRPGAVYLWEGRYGYSLN